MSIWGAKTLSSLTQRLAPALSAAITRVSASRALVASATAMAAAQPWRSVQPTRCPAPGDGGGENGENALLSKLSKELAMEGVELGAGDGAAILQSMKRTAILASWLLSLTAAFLIGRHTSERPFPIEELGSPEPSETSVGDRKPVSAVAVSGAGEAIKAAGSLSAAGRTY